MGKVAVPEKTLEHWCSQYLIYRYRSKLGLWWPTNGEDINVNGWFAAGLGSGKAIQLEVKTCTPTDNGSAQDVDVELGQLRDYLTRPLAHQPFYVFPLPDWPGELAAYAILNSVNPSELAFSRSGRDDWWFASWLVVLTTAEVGRLLTGKLAAHGVSSKKKRARLLRVDGVGRSGSVEQWGEANSATRPSGLTRWLDFWFRFDNCGEPGWPQVVRLPSNQRTLQHASLRNMLDRAADRRDVGALGIYNASGDGGFERVLEEDESGGGPSEAANGENESEAESRTAVFVSAAGLRLSRERETRSREHRQ